MSLNLLPGAVLLLLQLRGGEHNAVYSLLELFAYGTWADYKGGCRACLVLGGCGYGVKNNNLPPSATIAAFAAARSACRPAPTSSSHKCSCKRLLRLPLRPAAAPDKVPPLSDQQKHKLRLLTVVSMANGVRVGAWQAKRVQNLGHELVSRWAWPVPLHARCLAWNRSHGRGLL